MSLQHVGDGGIGDVISDVLKCSLNAIVAPRRIFRRKANDGIHDFLTDAWSTGFSLVAGVELSGHKFAVPAENRVWRDDGGEFQQSLASDGVSLYGKQATLVVVEQQAFLSELFDQGVNLSVLELNDLLLTLVRQAAECSQHDEPWLEQKGHVRRRKSASVRWRRMKSSGRHETTGSSQNVVFHGVFRSAELFDPAADG